jgi:hypothetical protein
MWTWTHPNPNLVLELHRAPAVVALVPLVPMPRALIWAALAVLKALWARKALSGPAALLGLLG